MNIFVLDLDPVIAAKSQNDKHCVKMVLETAQLLSSTIHILNPNSSIKDKIYKPTHKNHPATIWTRESLGNFNWLIKHGLALSDTYQARYNKIHKSREIILRCQAHTPNFTKIEKTPHVYCGPECYRTQDIVQSYRNYYIGDKAKFSTWKLPHEPPSWFILNK